MAREDLTQPGFHPEPRRILRIDRQGAQDEGVGTGLVAPFELDPGQADDRDRVVRVGRDRLGIHPLGLVDQAQAKGLLGLEHELDHPSSASIA
jgi:hypothetical protein